VTLPDDSGDGFCQPAPAYAAQVPAQINVNCQASFAELSR
jgi:hypothetical protein